MGINVRVQKPVKHGTVVPFHVKQDKDLQECLHCRYFYSNSRQCLAQHCTKELAEPRKQVDKNSPCYGCSYKKQEGYCFPCMKRILGKGGMDGVHNLPVVIWQLWNHKEGGAGMDKHMEIIGIDHGWSNMKTASQVFTTGVKEISTEPAFFDNVVEFGGVYYKVGGKRLEVRDCKVENDNFYILTLAAMAKELCRRGKKEADVLLSVGLPLTRFGAEKQEFISYLSRNKEVNFRFEKKKYRARIARVSVYPQCYAAVADRIATLPDRVVVVDIGSWTVDIMPILGGKPQEQECVTSPQGLIRCMREINEECVRQLGQELEESVIQQVMAGKGSLPDNYMAIVREHLHGFVEKIYHIIKEHGYNLDVTPIVFVGGGAAVMKQFGTQKGRNIQYIEDIRANAKGYEQLAKVFLSTMNRKAR